MLALTQSLQFIGGKYIVSMFFCKMCRSQFTRRNAQSALPMQPPSVNKNKNDHQARYLVINNFKTIGECHGEFLNYFSYLTFTTAIPLARASSADKLSHSFVTTLTFWHLTSSTRSHVVAVIGRRITAGSRSALNNKSR